MVECVTVVVSRGHSENPAKRQLEEDIITALLAEPAVAVTVIPHLNDVRRDGKSVTALQSIQGDLILLSWLYERAAHWTLYRNGILGHPAQAPLSPAHSDDTPPVGQTADDRRLATGSVDIPDRKIYCLDLRRDPSSQTYIDRVKRIVGSGPRPSDASPDAIKEPATQLEEPAKRRWYPVIDYSRCTNCMECVDFCLFGVYGVDEAESILVEQPDNCRKGCPACSRVCPESAIMFPLHATPAIAGAPAGAGSLKVDLSKLFGAPDDDRPARELALEERREQLQRSDADRATNDELDELIDSLDELDL